MDMELFEMVSARRLTPEEAVDIMMWERWLRTPWWARFLDAFMRTS
jgi:hypothetical protein